MPKGYLSLVLHSHLPFIRHPEYEDFLEEDWLYEAIFETYLPLIEVFDKLESDRVEWKLTISLTPPLISMLTDPLLQERAVRHIDSLIELINKEVERTANELQINRVVRMYQEKFIRLRYVYVEKYGKNLVNAFKKFQDLGNLEIITCPATHCFFPLIEMYPVAVRAQIKIAVDFHTKHFGKPPSGIWLAECGYHPGVDLILKEFGIKYFFVDSHGILFASPRPKYGVFAPFYCSGSGVAVFARDIESSKQVWSAKEGYPGDYEYRDFYRDVGFDLDYEYIKPYIHPDGKRIYTGIKYYKITGAGDFKEVYIPERAIEKASQHAGNFMFNREKQVEYLSGGMDRSPIIVAPYDAELYGHWWYEGPDWLNFLIRKICYDQDNIKLITPSMYLKMYPENQVSNPSMSSWGWKGYNEVWLNGSNDWTYRYIHKAIERMMELANSSNESGMKRRALNQALRELLLAQSSDWQFIMKTGTYVEYAVKRIKEHILNFTRLYDEIKANSIEEVWLSNLEYKNNIFPDIDYRIYKP